MGELIDAIASTARTRSSRAVNVAHALHSLVGEQLARQITVIEVKGSVLTLAASHPTTRFSVERSVRRSGGLAPELLALGVSRMRWRTGR